jgi:hypothetical protein
MARCRVEVLREGPETVERNGIARTAAVVVAEEEVPVRLAALADSSAEVAAEAVVEAGALALAALA